MPIVTSPSLPTVVNEPVSISSAAPPTTSSATGHTSASTTPETLNVPTLPSSSWFLSVGAPVKRSHSSRSSNRRREPHNEVANQLQRSHSSRSSSRPTTTRPTREQRADDSRGQAQTKRSYSSRSTSRLELKPPTTTTTAAQAIRSHSSRSALRSITTSQPGELPTTNGAQRMRSSSASRRPSRCSEGPAKLGERSPTEQPLRTPTRSVHRSSSRSAALRRNTERGGTTHRSDLPAATVLPDAELEVPPTAVTVQRRNTAPSKLGRMGRRAGAAAAVPPLSPGTVPPVPPIPPVHAINPRSSSLMAPPSPLPIGNPQIQATQQPNVRSSSLDPDAMVTTPGLWTGTTTTRRVRPKSVSRPKAAVPSHQSIATQATQALARDHAHWTAEPVVRRSHSTHSRPERHRAECSSGPLRA